MRRRRCCTAWAVAMSIEEGSGARFLLLRWALGERMKKARSGRRRKKEQLKQIPNEPMGTTTSRFLCCSSSWS